MESLPFELEALDVELLEIEPLEIVGLETLTVGLLGHGMVEMPQNASACITCCCCEPGLTCYVEDGV